MKPIMLRRTNIIWVTVVIALLMATGVMFGVARSQDTASVPKPQDRVAIGQDEVKQLLLLMDTDKNGYFLHE